MANLSYTVDQIGNLASQYIAAHGQKEWNEVIYDGTNLVVPDALVSKVQALDPDKQPVPGSVTMVQCREQLIIDGHIDAVETALQADTSTEGKRNLAKWEYSTVVPRDAPLVTAMAAVLNLDEDDVDQMFRDAATIE